MGLILFVGAIAVVAFFTITRNRNRPPETTVELEAPEEVPVSAFTQLKDVTVEGKIGSGAFGVVYKGSWMGTTVALKKLASQSELAEFNHEAEILQ